MKLVLNRKQKAWTILGVSAFLCLACAGLAYMDYTEIQEEEKKIDTAKQQNAKADATIAQLKKVEDRVLAERLRVEEYTKILPLDKEINAFVETITQFEAASGVEIEVLDDKEARSRGKKKSREAFVRIVYKVDCVATVSQFLEFLHLFESFDRFVNVKEFSVKGNDPKVTESGDVLAARHDISMLLETYVYNPKGRISKPVKILNAEQRMSDLAARMKDDHTLELDAYDFVLTSKRRDPFSNPRRSLEPKGELDTEALEEQRAVIAQLEKELQELQALAEREQSEKEVVIRFELARQVNERAQAFASKLTALDVAKTFGDGEERRAFEAKVNEPFMTFMKNRPEVAGLNVPIQELRNQLERMEESFAAEKWSDTVSLGKALVQSRPAAMPEEMVAPYGKVEELLKRAQVRLDFEQIELAFNGLVLPENAPERSVVIINGRAYSPGDRFDEALVVKDVRPAEVAFVYRGEEILRRIDD